MDESTKEGLKKLVWIVIGAGISVAMFKAFAPVNDKKLDGVRNKKRRKK